MFHIMDGYSDKRLATFEDLDDAYLHVPYYEWLLEFERPELYIEDDEGNFYAI